MEYVVTGIGTDVGKTVVSAIVCKMLDADYWKPVQTGLREGSDAQTVGELIGTDRIHPSAYALHEPLSPHAAAELEGIEIHSSGLRIPTTNRPLVIEGAGGVHVPLNDRHTFLDLLQVWDVPVIVVSRNYLGSINHTLLTIELLQQRGIPVAGVVFNGAPTPSSERIILSYTKLPLLGRVPQLEAVNQAGIAAFADAWRESFHKKLFERHPLNLEIELKKRLLFDHKGHRHTA
jgi:dethiobiotin synthetase